MTWSIERPVPWYESVGMSWYEELVLDDAVFDSEALLPPPDVSRLLGWKLAALEVAMDHGFPLASVAI